MNDPEYAFISIGNLSPRQSQICSEICERDLTDAQIADKLGVSIHTVGMHLQKIYRKLGVNTRCALSRWYYTRKAIT